MDSKDFENAYGFEPSKEQWTAITAPLEPGIIVAGAGTGKTTTMAARISWLIATGEVNPEKILGLTFTKKAATELASRVRAMRKPAIEFRSGKVDDIELGEPTISTYNSFGARLLKEHGLRIGIEPDARVVVDATRYQLAMRIVTQTKVPLAGLGFTNVVKVVKDLLELDSQCSDYLVDPSQVIQSDEELMQKLDVVPRPQNLTTEMKQTAQQRIALAQLVMEFRESKKREGMIDYSDQIRLAAQAALSSAEMRQMLKEQYEVVLLDEYQDTSVAQKKLLNALFGDGHPVLAVGDPCQAIYGWRGAEVANIENFHKDFKTSDGKEARKYELKTNRRSGQLILNTANKMSNALRAIHKAIVELTVGANDTNPGEVHTAVLNTFPEEVQWIADQIQEQAKSTPLSDIAILLRQKKHGALFVAALEERGIPVQVADAEVLIELPEVRDALCYLELMVDPTANTALVRLLAGPKWRIGARDLALLGRHAAKLAGYDYELAKHLPVAEQLQQAVAGVDRADRVCLLDALELAAESNIDYSEEAKSRFIELAAQLRELRKHAGDTAIDAIARIIRVSGLGIQALSRPMALGKAHDDRLGSLIDLAGAYRSLDGDSSVHSFVRFLADGRRFDQLPDAEITLTKDAVVLMTVHKSKGLEFPVVAVPNITLKSFPSTGKALQHWPTTPSLLPLNLKENVVSDPRVDVFVNGNAFRGTDFENYKKCFNELRELDERRLAYVAVTRAKGVFIASSSWWGTTQKKYLGPTKFMHDVIAHATHQGPMTPQPEDGSTNPLFNEREYLLWPHDISPEDYSYLLSQADLVRQAQKSSLDEQVSTDAEKLLIAQWDADIEALLAGMNEYAQEERLVSLPDTLTASQVVAMQKDEIAFARSLIRPMPRKPAPEAERGTNFHTWVEDYYGKRMLGNLIDDPVGVDSPVYDDSALEKLKEAFTNGVFASRSPHDLETPFSLVVNGRPLIGRIDAVFTGSLENPDAEGKWTVVDWKTGAPGSADPLQLHIYRAAWAQTLQVPIESVDAAFYYVGHQVVEPLNTLMSVDELADLI